MVKRSKNLNTAHQSQQSVQKSVAINLPNNQSIQSLLKVFVFLGFFIGFQFLYELSAGTWVDRLIIEDIIVGSAANLIGWITPEVGVLAVGVEMH